MGGCDHAAVLPAHEGCALPVSPHFHRNTTGFLWNLQTPVRHCGKDDECNRRPSHRRGLGAPLRSRRGRISPANAWLVILLLCFRISTPALKELASPTESWT